MSGTVRARIFNVRIFDSILYSKYTLRIETFAETLMRVRISPRCRAVISSGLKINLLMLCFQNKSIVINRLVEVISFPISGRLHCSRISIYFEGSTWMLKIKIDTRFNPYRVTNKYFTRETNGSQFKRLFLAIDM